MLLVGTLASVVLLEQAMRVYIFAAAAFSYERMASMHSLGESGLIRASEQPELLYELRPDVKTLYELYDFQTNSHGLRDRDYSLQKPQGVFRVAVVGDSLTLGSGVPIEEVYHSVLEERLNARSPSARYEFINFGISGYYLSHYVAMIRHRALEWDPDLVLIGFFAGNDARIPPADKFSQPYRVKPVANGFWEMHSFSLAGDIWKYSIVPGVREALGGGSDEGVGPPPEQYEWVDRQFADLAELLGPLGIPLVVANLDNRASGRGWVGDVVQNHGFLFVDTTGGFAGTDVNDYAIYLTDKHPNGAANLIFAEAILARLDEEGILAPPVYQSE